MDWVVTLGKESTSNGKRSHDIAAIEVNGEPKLTWRLWVCALLDAVFPMTGEYVQSHLVGHPISCLVSVWMWSIREIFPCMWKLCSRRFQRRMDYLSISIWQRLALWKSYYGRSMVGKQSEHMGVVSGWPQGSIAGPHMDPKDGWTVRWLNALLTRMISSFLL